MNPFHQGAVVRIVNRVRDENGKPVPQEMMLGGEAGWLIDTMQLPVGLARIVIQQSMFKIDPLNSQPDFRIGCREFDVPETPLPLGALERNELIDRTHLPGKVQPVRVHNPINPRQAAPPVGPRHDADGAFAGEYGDRRS